MVKRSLTYRTPRIGTLLIALCAPSFAFAGEPPSPSQPHPRLFMTLANIAAFGVTARTQGTAASRLVNRCQESIDNEKYYTSRGGADGDTWPGAAVSCAFAWRATSDPKYLSQALKYWRIALEDDQNAGDGLGCTAAHAAEGWRSWNDSPPAPGAIITVTHDTGYPMRWYGPWVALTYDWLYDAPGVDEGLRTQTRQCLTAWSDWYTQRGYMREQPGSNYNAGFVIAKTLAAIAIGSDGGSDGHLWSETLHGIFETTLVGKGLANSQAPLGTPTGNMVGGDWGSWQYGPLSTAEYAAATRALEENGAAQPAMDAWLSSVALRYVHGTLPAGNGQFMGNGDYDNDLTFPALTQIQADAVLLGPTTDHVAAWAQFQRSLPNNNQGYMFWSALAEIRQVKAEDFRAQDPRPPLWYLARGTGSMYVRSGWDANAFWGVIMSAPWSGDHQHLAASNTVFLRGVDPIIIDSSNYGEPSTFETNAVSVDSAVCAGDYNLTQTPWTNADLPWARGTSSGVFAARAEFAHAFDFNGTPSDVSYAHREWVFLPEGEMITIDRVHTGGPQRAMYINFTTKTDGTLKLDDNATTAVGTVGGSKVAIHSIYRSSGTPTVRQPHVGGCAAQCNFPCGACDAARFPVDRYSLKVDGAWAVAVHAIDGLGGSESPAVVGSLNDDNFDPNPKMNAGVLGAAVYRASKQSYVVASSAQDGASPQTMTYGTPGGSPARHLVYDAPQAGDGTSVVVAAVMGDRCAVTITAGGGGGMQARPLMFQVASAADGCTVKADPDVAPGVPPPGGGIDPLPTDGGVLEGGGCCLGGSDGGGGNPTPGELSGGVGACRTGAGGRALGSGLPILMALALLVRRRRR